MTQSPPPDPQSECDNKRPPLAHPAVLLATWFGSGWLKPAPGTWGTLASLPFAWNIVYYLGQPALWVATGVVFVIGIWASKAYCIMTNTHDNGEIVIDEVAGMWFTVCLLPLSWQSYLIAFLLFRLFDIVKPFPIATLDSKVKGGFGVMLDDIVAGAMAMLTTGLILMMARDYIYA